MNTLQNLVRNVHQAFQFIGQLLKHAVCPSRKCHLDGSDTAVEERDELITCTLL